MTLILTSDRTFFFSLKAIVLQKYKQKNGQLALRLGGGEHPGKLKSQGRKTSQYEKVLSREKELEPVGNLLKSPSSR